MKYLAFAILAIALIVSCSGGDKSTGPEYTPSISAVPGLIALTSAAEAYKLPDPISEVFTNNTEDTLRCYLTSNSDWLHYDTDTLYLLPHTSQTVSVSVTVAGLPVMMHQDTLFLFNAADSTRMRYVPIRLTIIVNNTYLTMSDQAMSYEYLGKDGDLYYYNVTCSWTMACHSNGGNPAYVFQYVASMPYSQVTSDVNVAVQPDVQVGHQTKGSIKFAIISYYGPQLSADWQIAIGYNAIGQEHWISFEYHT